MLDPRPQCWFFAALAFGVSGLVAGAEEGGFKLNLDLPFAADGDPDVDDVFEGFRFYGGTYEGDGVFFCLDRSNSTQDSGELVQEKREAIHTIAEFSARVEFGVVFYDCGVIRWPPEGKPVEANPQSKALSRSWIVNTPGGSGTCVKGGLVACLDFANRSSARRNLILVLTDGCTTCIGKDPDAYARETLREVRARNLKRVTISAICVGPQGEVCEEFPKTLASMNGGSYRRIPK